MTHDPTQYGFRLYSPYVLFPFFFFFSVRLLSVLSGQSVFSSPPQRPMTSDFEGFSIPDFIHYIYFPILVLKKEPVFPFWMFSAKQGHYWYHFYNVFGMTRSLTGDWTLDLPHVYLWRNKGITSNSSDLSCYITAERGANVVSWQRPSVM